MGKLKYLILICVFLNPFVGTAQERLRALSVDSIQVLKISPQDERAVIKTPDGEMRIIKVGDRVGENGKVIEITDGRVVIDERTDKSSEIVIIRSGSGNQKSERITKAKDEQPLLFSPTQEEKRK